MTKYAKLCKLAITNFIVACKGVYHSEIIQEPEIPRDYMHTATVNHPVVLKLIALSYDFQYLARHHRHIEDSESSQFFGDVSAGLETIAKTITRNVYGLTQTDFHLSKIGVLYAPIETPDWQFNQRHPLSTWAGTLTEIMREGKTLEPVAVEEAHDGFRTHPTDSRVHKIHELIETVKAVQDDAKAQALSILTTLQFHLILATSKLPKGTLEVSVGYDGNHITGRTA